MTEEVKRTDAADSSASSGFRLPLWMKFILMLVLVLLASIGYLKSSFWQMPEFSKPKPAELDSGGVEKRVPVTEFKLTDAEGKTKSLSDYRGKVVVVSFWASWCSPCLVELPMFAKLKETYEDEGLEIIPVNLDEAEDGRNFAKEFWAKKNFDFPNFFDPEKNIAKQFNVEILPSNFVIDRQGRLVFSGFGANDWNGPEAVEFLESLLNETADSEKGG